MQTIQQLPSPPPFAAVLMMSHTLLCVQVNRYKTGILKIDFFLSFNNIYSEFQNIIFFGHMKEFFFLKKITFIFINSLAG